MCGKETEQVHSLNCLEWWGRERCVELPLNTRSSVPANLYFTYIRVQESGFLLRYKMAFAFDTSLQIPLQHIHARSQNHTFNWINSSCFNLCWAEERRILPLTSVLFPASLVFCSAWNINKSPSLFSSSDMAIKRSSRKIKCVAIPIYWLFLSLVLWGWQNIVQTDKMHKKTFRFWQHLQLNVVYVGLGEEWIKKRVTNVHVRLHVEQWWNDGRWEVKMAKGYIGMLQRKMNVHILLYYYIWYFLLGLYLNVFN